MESSQKQQQRQIKSETNEHLQKKIKGLLNNKVLNVKFLKPHHIKHKFENFVSEDSQESSLRKVTITYINSQTIEVGQACKGIVVRKEQSSKQLWIHLTKLVISQPQNKYKMLVTTPNQKLKDPQQKFIHQFRQFAFIKDYGIKEPFSIFTYINTFNDIKIGSEVFGVLIRKQKRKINSLTKHISQNQNSQTWFEISIKNEMPNLKEIGKISQRKYGINNDQRFKDVVDESYLKNGNFSISKLALYVNHFQNDQKIASLKQKLDIELNQNINPISNIKTLKHMHIKFERIRQVQEKNWAEHHFSQGIEFLKNGNNQCAIQNFDVAKRFDKNNQKIYIGKGCALANMNNFSEGLKQIKEALRINPDNEQSNQYYKTIREKLRQKDFGPQMRKKRSHNSQY